jgi:hypothetical protein
LSLVAYLPPCLGQQTITIVSPTTRRSILLSKSRDSQSIIFREQVPANSFVVFPVGNVDLGCAMPGDPRILFAGFRQPVLRTLK